MMTLDSRGLGRSAAGTMILLWVAAASSTGGCASAGRRWSSAPQVAAGVSGARVTPGTWDRVEALRPGSPLVVTLKSGDRIEGAFKALRLEMLDLTDPARNGIECPEIGSR